MLCVRSCGNTEFSSMEIVLFLQWDLLPCCCHRVHWAAESTIKQRSSLNALQQTAQAGSSCTCCSWGKHRKRKQYFVRQSRALSFTKWQGLSPIWKSPHHLHWQWELSQQTEVHEVQGTNHTTITATRREEDIKRRKVDGGGEEGEMGWRNISLNSWNWAHCPASVHQSHRTRHWVGKASKLPSPKRTRRWTHEVPIWRNKRLIPSVFDSELWIATRLLSSCPRQIGAFAKTLCWLISSIVIRSLLRTVQPKKHPTTFLYLIHASSHRSDRS